MKNLLGLSLQLGALFVSSVGIAYASFSLSRKRKLACLPKPGQMIRMRGLSGFYRSRFIAAGDKVWEISLPVQRDNFVPLRVGEEIVVEASTPKGALIFRTKVFGGEVGPSRIQILAPANPQLVERREYARDPKFKGEKVKVDSLAARVIDYSQGGICLQSARTLNRGDQVRIELPWQEEPVDAWVLDSEGLKVRLRFSQLTENVSHSRLRSPAQVF